MKRIIVFVRGSLGFGQESVSRNILVLQTSNLSSSLIFREKQQAKSSRAVVPLHIHWNPQHSLDGVK